MALQVRDELVRALLARVQLFAATMDRDAVLADEAVEQARALMARVPDPARDPQAVDAVAGLYRARSLVLTGAGATEAHAIAEALRDLAGPGDDEVMTDDRSAEEIREAWDLVDELDRRAIELELVAQNSLGDADDLDRAEEAARATVEAAPSFLLPLRAAAQRRLGSILRLRYEVHGDRAALDEAIRLLREAESAHGTAHPDRGTLATTLGVALRLRYERTNALGDLEEAIRFARVAVEVAGADPDPSADGSLAEDDPNRAGCLHNLGIALRLRYERLGEPGDLQETRQLEEAAAAMAGPGHPAFGMVRLGLGNASSEEERAAAYEEALAGLPPGDPMRPRLLFSLADTLTQNCLHGGDPAGAVRAEALLDEAADTLPETHGDHAQLLYLRGRLRLVTGLRTAMRLGVVPTRHYAEARRSLQAAATHPAASPRIRLWALTAWAGLAMATGDASQAARVYGEAVDLLPVLTPRHLTDADTEHTLTALSGLACDAAAACLAAGAPERALALLESGRGVLLGRGLQGRDDLSDLQRAHPDTAARLLALRTALDTPHTTTPTDRFPDGTTPADVRHLLAGQWNDLLAEIRATLPGFAYFLRPPPVRELLQQARNGPVVVVNVSRFRCDALILTPDALSILPLPDLTFDEVQSHAKEFRTVLREFADPDRDILEDPDRQDTLDLILRRLWDTVADPVLAVLGMDGRFPRRLWWVPTGPLTALPLHAAGHHREPARSTPRTVLDRAVSSYTPTIRALAHTRSRPASSARGRRRDPGRFLIVAVPDARLERAAEEAELLAAALPGAEVLGGGRATRQRVLQELCGHGWLHFCGHGVTDPVSPSRSHLVLHDPAGRRLTVADISRLDLPGAELAYLSACGTAGTGPALADEALHLASALQLAGYRHVVGTLWEIDDTVALELAGRVYQALGAPRPVADRSAHALHAAVRAVRDTYRDSPWFWAAHVHVGA